MVSRTLFTNAKASFLSHMITIFAFDVERLSNTFLLRWEALSADDYNKTEAVVGAIVGIVLN